MFSVHVLAISFWRITVSRLLRHLKFRATIKHFLSHRRTTYFNYFVVFQAAVISSQLASFQFARSALDSARTALGRGIKSERNARGAVVSPSAAAFSRRAVPRPELSSLGAGTNGRSRVSRCRFSGGGIGLRFLCYYFIIIIMFIMCIVLVVFIIIIIIVIIFIIILPS